MPTVAFLMNGAYGLLRVKRTVERSTSSTTTPSQLARNGLLAEASWMVVTVKTTSAAVSGVPSWNCASGLKVNVYTRPSSDTVYAEARSGM
jgi:hypothetical protein